MDEITEYREKLIHRLEYQPEELKATLNILPEAQWHDRRLPDGRSVHQLVAHIRDLETLAFRPRFRLVLMEERPILEAFASHTWSAGSYEAGEPLGKMLAEFEHARAEAVALMRPLTPADWARAGFHPPSGWRSAQWWAERMYQHANNHLTDIRRVMGRLLTRPVAARRRATLIEPEPEDNLT
jgi:hypothetical protein